MTRVKQEMPHKVFRWLLGITALLSYSLMCHAADKVEFADVVIEQPFKPYLLGNPLLMEVSGAKVIRENGQRTVLLSVASTVLKDNSAKERLRAEKVCRIKALAGFVAEQHGIQVAHTEILKESTHVVIDNAAESGMSISELLQITQTKVEGLTKDMPVVGRWYSNDGSVFYLAIGAILDKNGEIIENEAAE